MTTPASTLRRPVNGSDQWPVVVPVGFEDIKAFVTVNELQVQIKDYAR